MAHGESIWCDLSTFDVPQARRFYADLFGWAYQETSQPDGSPYHVAGTRFGEIAGLFEMPEKFRALGLPSFWMPYFTVDHVGDACTRAAQNGGKVEVGPLDWFEHDQIALIRDPLGAGFTVHQGSGLVPPRHPAPAGHLIGFALYVSDVAAVRTFYSEMFGWHISPTSNAAEAYRAETSQGHKTIEIHEVDEALRGPYQFWGVHFAVEDVSEAERMIVTNGGEITFADATSLLAKDPDGASFFIRQEQRGANP